MLVLNTVILSMLGVSGDVFPEDRTLDCSRSSLIVLPKPVNSNGSALWACSLGMFRQEVAYCYLENHWKILLLRGPSASIQLKDHPYTPHRANHSNVGSVIFKC